jgi:hypothetical protein
MASSPKAVVFTHLVLPRSSTPLFVEERKEQVRKVCRALVRMYDKCPSVGLVYVFIAEGYQALLSGKKPFQSLYADRLLRDILIEERKNSTGKIEIVRIRELVPFMAKLSAEFETRRSQGNDERRLGELLLGHGERLYYDSPKLVEAIIRLARFAKKGQEPIFRFDADVEVDQVNVERLLSLYEKLAKKATGADHSAGNPASHYFRSGGYRARTRTQEDRLFNQTPVRTAQFWDVGRQELNATLANRFLDELALIGADPRHQVTSGAGLMISFRAISELPPFANASEQIVWIDDHLKRILHEELGHFGMGKRRKNGRRAQQVTFVQDRYPEPARDLDSESLNWHREDYLDRLIRGCLLDAAVLDRDKDRAGLLADWVFHGTLMNQPMAAALRNKLQIRMGRIKSLWTAYPEGSAPSEYVRKRLSSLKQQQNGITMTVEAALIEDAVATAENYLKLVQVWPLFCRRCESIDEAENTWLFRDP